MAMRMGFVTHAVARHATSHWHYSRSMPVPPVVALGIWEAGSYRGCCVFSRGASSNLHRPFQVATTEVCELTRIAMRAHTTPVSRIISVAVAMLRRQNPGLKVIVSYADPAHGHVGAVYQASNWVYLGLTAPAVAYRTKAGRVIHSRAVSASGFVKYHGKMQRVRRAQDLDRYLQPGKHKYVLPLSPAVAQIVAGMARPYPKRVGSGPRAPEA